MKKVCFIFIYILGIYRIEAQVNVGLKLNPGIGFIKSSTLDKIAALEKSNDGSVVVSNARTGAGLNMGIGGFYQYNINPKISILAEPTFNLLYSRTYLNYKKEVVDQNGSGSQIRISSIGKISLFYLNLPFIVKYTIWEPKKVYAIGGLSVNINTKPKLRSEETVVYTEYMYENVKQELEEESRIEKINNKATLDKFSLIQPNLVLGIGKSFRRKLKNLSVDLRYNLPLTRTVMYSNDSTIANNTLNNSLYSNKDQWKMGDSSLNLQRPNNFSMGVINISIKYILYKKTKA